MGQRNSKVQIIPSKSNYTSQKPSTDNDIHRIAINRPGVLGSLYDARTDRILDNSVLQIPSTSIAVQKSEDRIVIDSGILEEKSITDIIGIDGELWLSINLKIIPLVDFSFERNKYTRFLYYYYPSVEEYIINNKIKVNVDTTNSISQMTATHIITAIKSGIRVLMIMQLSPDNVSHFDRLFEKIKKQLNENYITIKSNEKDLLDRFTSTKVFSNISDLNKLTKLTDVCQKIIEIKSDINHHRPLEYTLQPIRSFYPSYPEKKARYVSLKSKSIEQIKQYLHQLSLIMKSLNVPIDFELKESTNEHLKRQYDRIRQQIVEITSRDSHEVNRISDLVLGYRSGNFREETFTEALINGQDKGLLTEIHNINDRLHTLQVKVQLIIDCENQKINYLNIEELSTQQDDTLQTIEQKILNNDRRQRIFCCNDELRKKNPSQWMDFYTQLTNERQTNSQLKLIYADFSYCSYYLPAMKMLPSDHIEQQPRRLTSWTPIPSDAASPSTNKNRHEQPKLPLPNFINILLLGESGVGKSTFINALVNYLAFETFDRACASQPIALTPVSFLITDGDHFEEHSVTFGEPDPNEDYNHSGQSVTQRCRSYVFDTGNQIKLRLIDTPGMGDTRGLFQDDLNMQHILSFINNLSHLNAICILLKPNESRLNIVLRSYLTRLLDFLGENVRDNIIFCFTNTRGTFFAPGNTGPLLKKMLESHSIKNIPFKQTNTFCFDNEAFRYLIARQTGIKFDDYQNEEYQQSWLTSAKESNRLFKYINKNLNAYPQEDWKSIEHAQFLTIQVIRPMLETTRNIMRNIILLNKTSSKSLIKLHPSPVPSNSAICIGCKRSSILYGEFWIITDDSHVLSDRCNKCQCYFVQHIKVDYKLGYEMYDHNGEQSLDELRTNLDGLKRIIRKFAYFFNFLAHMLKENDPLLSVLNRMIAEEKIICSQHGVNSLNSNLYVELVNLKQEYERTWTTSISNQKSFSLSDTYKLINDINENNTVKGQISVIKQVKETYMKEHEKQIECIPEVENGTV